MKDSPYRVAYNFAAPLGERQDAQREVQKKAMPQAIDQLIPAARLAPLIEFISRQAQDQEFAKSLSANNVVPFPSYASRNKQPGMQSVVLDDIQIGVMGDYYERQGVFNFDSMRMMVDQTPVLSAVVLQRIRQIQRFCRPQRDGKGAGFKITPRDKDNHIGEDGKDQAKLLEKFFLNCGWESNPRARKRLKREDFSSFMAKLVRDSLIMDSCPIETEFKRDPKQGIDGIYAVDGSTIRLCTEQGYRGDDEIFAIQLVQGQIRSAYTYDNLIYVPRNPRTDVLSGGYGLSETELLVRVVTGFLNAFTYNIKFFDSNSMPKGILNLYGDYDPNDLAAFKRNWNAMVRGVNNSWAMPVMVSKNMESKAQYEAFGNEVSELMFGKWMTFLTSIICAIYGMAPDEINFESFTNGTSSLSGGDTEEKIANSKDKGLRPLLSYFENMFTDYVVTEFSEDFEFRWTGLDEEDPTTAWERVKLTTTANELRAEDGRDKIEEAWGDAPLNSSLMSAWSLDHQPEQDFGQPGISQPPGAGGAPGGDEGDPENDFGDPGPDNDTGGDFGNDQAGGGGGVAAVPLAKAFGLPALKIEA